MLLPSISFGFEFGTFFVQFQVPLVPLVPALSMMINIYLMVNMRMFTWIQYAIYMALGLSVYVIYGWRHSKEEYRMRGILEEDK